MARPTKSITTRTGQISKTDIDKIKYEAKLRGNHDKIMNIMKLINFATGAVAGRLLYEACVDYQDFFCLIWSTLKGIQWIGYVWY